MNIDKAEFENIKLHIKARAKCYENVANQTKIDFKRSLFERVESDYLLLLERFEELQNS